MRVLIATLLIALSTVVMADVRVDQNSAHFPWDAVNVGKQFVIRNIQTNEINLGGGLFTLSAEFTANYKDNHESLPLPLQGGWIKSINIENFDDTTRCRGSRHNYRYEADEWTLKLIRLKDTVKGSLVCKNATRIIL